VVFTEIDGDAGEMLSGMQRQKRRGINVRLTNSIW